MKSLLLKDVFTLTKQMRLYLLVIAVFAVIPEISTFGIVYMAILPMISISFDERCHWDQLAAMMPYSTKQLVLGKYVLGYLAIGIAALLSFLSQPLTSLLLKQASEVAVIPMAVLFALLAVALILPPIFLLGVEKGRVIYLLLAVVFAFGGMKIGESMPEYVPRGVVLVTVLCVVALNLLSIVMSVQFYQKRYRQ